MIVRQALIAIAVAVVVVAIADFVLWETATESEPTEAPNAEILPKFHNRRAYIPRLFIQRWSIHDAGRSIVQLE
jgi:hypothetical protein